METVADLMAKWPKDAEFCRDVGITLGHGHVMKIRNSLPVWRWPAVIKAASKRRIRGVNNDSLARILKERSRASA